MDLALLQSVPMPDLDGKGLRIGIIVARYNWNITGELLRLACRELLRLGVAEEDIEVETVPGAYELATLAQAMLSDKAFDALICFGCVMKGETRHDVLVGDAAAQGIQRVALDSGIPVIFGVLAAENQQQAEARIERGIECAHAAIEMGRKIQALHPKVRQ